LGVRTRGPTSWGKKQCELDRAGSKATETQLARCRHIQDPGGPVGLAGTDPEPPRLMIIVPDNPDEEEPIATDREGPPVAPREKQASEGKSCNRKHGQSP
jgi:hypothetical protein